MRKFRTYEEFMNDFKLKNIHADYIDILVKPKYVKVNDKLLCKCKIDGYEWYASVNNLLNMDAGCRTCGNNRRGRTYEKFINQFKLRNKHSSNIEILTKCEYLRNKDMVLCRCKIDGYEWSTSARHLLYSNSGCKECGYRKRTKTHEKFLEELSNINTNITPLDNYINTNTKITFKCNICNLVWKNTPAHILNGQGCPCCSGRRVVIGINDMWTTATDMAKALLNIDDGYKYSKYSHKPVDWRCLGCGNIIYNKKIDEVARRGLSCSACSDGIGIPEKFLSNILDSLNIKYEHNKGLFGINRRYDFYIKSINVIIETHGLQHYNGHVGWNISLQEQIENDLYKEKIAKENGVENYVIIDCRKSELEWIKTSVLNSKMSEIFNLSDIDWINCFKNSLTSNVIKACDLCNKNLNTIAIAECCKVSTSTVLNYIKRGKEIGLCI